MTGETEKTYCYCTKGDIIIDEEHQSADHPCDFFDNAFVTCYQCQFSRYVNEAQALYLLSDK